MCSVCGRAADDAHHISIRGMGGRGEKADEAESQDSTPLCRDCHDAIHKAGELRLRRNKQGVLLWTAKGKTAKRLHAKEEHEHASLHEGIDPDTVDAESDAEDVPDVIAALQAKILGVEAAENRAYRIACLHLLDARNAWLSLYGPRDGLARFRRWRENHLQLGESPASKMLTVATYLGEDAADDKCQSYQYAIARAVKRGVSVEDAVAESAMPLRDFMAHHFPAKDKPEVERVSCPMGYTCSHAKEA